MSKKIILTLLILVVILLINPLTTFAQTLSDNYRHHLHTFSSNYNNAAHLTSGKNYAFEHRYAMEMGFSMISRGKPEEDKYNELGILKPHNALQFPIRFLYLNTGNSDDIKFVYRDFYNKEFDPAVGQYKSAFDETRHVLTHYDIDQNIKDFIKIYACAQENADLSRLDREPFSYDLLNELFYRSWTRKVDGVVESTNLFMNWHNEFVANDIAAKTIDSLNYMDVDGIFFDQISGYKGTCSNADHDPNDNYGSFPNGGVGQKYFLKTVNDQVKNMQNRKGLPYFITVNIGQPKTKSGSRAARWYADPDESSRLRFDHYYAETGVVRNIDTGEVITDLKANGVVPDGEPDAGKPAFINTIDGVYHGYFPANKVSLDTEGGWYTTLGVVQQDLVGTPHREDDYYNSEHCYPPPNIIDYDDYNTQHLRVLGVAGNQGSWFGWYKGWLTHEDYYICENDVPRLKTDAEKEIVYTDNRKLMQVVPNWDNLKNIPLAQRQWDEANLIYQSTNDGNIQSHASPDVIYSRHPFNNELFVVFVAPNGRVVLGDGETVKSAYFVNEYFEPTLEDAMSCLDINGNDVFLKTECIHKLKTGIRISSTKPPYTNGLVSHWSFDEDSGDAIDSISGHNGKLVNGASRSAGISGNSLQLDQLDEVDDFVFVGDVLDMHTSDMSISFWVKTDSENHVALVSKAYSVPYFNIVKPNHDVVRADLHNGTSPFTSAESNSKINDNEWHHIVTVYDRNALLHIYVDGVEENTVDISADKDVLISNPSALSFGTNCKYAALVDDDQGNKTCKPSFSNQLQGSLDEIKIFNKALTAQDVMDLYKEFTAVDGDADGDGDVDITDYSIWLSEYGGNPPDSIFDPDFNNDGDVDGEDFVIWLNNYSPS